MNDVILSGVADEAPWNRRVNPSGALQRHYVLEPALITGDGVCADGVIVVVGARGTYVYAADEDGEIADYWEITTACAGTTAASVLCQLGYCTVTPYPEAFPA